MPGARRTVLAIDHFFQQSGFAERTGERIVLKRQSSNLRMQDFDIHGRSRRSRFGVIAKNACRPIEELILPLRDLM